MSGSGETADRSRASDAAALPYAVSAEDGGNPFAREGGSYDSVRPAYPDEAVAAHVVELAQREAEMLLRRS